MAPRLITCDRCGCQSYPGVRMATWIREDWGWIQQQLWLFDFAVWDDLLISYRNRFVRAQNIARKEGKPEHLAEAMGRRAANSWLLGVRPAPELPRQAPSMLANIVTERRYEYEIVGKGPLL